jgi:hypothetical protein
VLWQEFRPASDVREVHVPIDSNDSKNHRYLSRVESIGTKLVPYSSSREPLTNYLTIYDDKRTSHYSE